MYVIGGYWTTGQSLHMESVNEVKELGVQFTADLKPSKPWSYNKRYSSMIYKQSELAYNCVKGSLVWVGRRISYKEA